MNAWGPSSATAPVENLSWRATYDGVYKIAVNQYNQRSTNNVGFELEVECDGKIQQFSHAAAAKGVCDALHIEMKDGHIVKITSGKGLVGGTASQEKWGVHTEVFTKVRAIMLSPNFWGDSAVGNKHHFFILEGCKSDAPTRGIYNEFLRPEFEKHRKVFEILGSKTMCPPATEQLSGLGFSSTRGDTVTVRADKRTYNIIF
jgi:hypothetical protein